MESRHWSVDECPIRPEEGETVAKQIRVWMILVVLIGTTLAGAYLIVERNGGAADAGEAPAGIFH